MYKVHNGPNFQKHPKMACAPFYALKTSKTEIPYVLRLLRSEGSRLILTRFTAIEFFEAPEAPKHVTNGSN